jgi:cytochrome c553
VSVLLRRAGVPILLLLLLRIVLWDGAAAGGEELDYERDIVPVLRGHCLRCHGPDTRKGELDLSTARGVWRGSESGVVVRAGQPDESRLLEVVVSGEMPPEGEGEPLAPEQAELIRRWIQLQAAKPAPAVATEAVPNQHQVLPILLSQCAACHGRQAQEGGLDVRHLASLLKGGKSGPALVPGKPDQSGLVQRIRAGQMPPREKLAKYSVKPVDDGELKQLVDWIATGAPWVDIPPDVATVEQDPLVSQADRQHWAFQPPRLPLPPADWRLASTPDNPAENLIDAFVIDKLRQHQLTLAPRATRAALARRLYFDLIGLPPSAAELRDFVADPRPQAYEALVDRLLSSPAYGERWGQYWLDLAGYADSEGVQHADPVRPHAYRYRDYVIRALNQDTTYDRFLLEQIAGDELADYEHAETITDEIYDNLVATGFLRMTSDGTFAGITGFLPNRLDVIDDQIRVLSSSVMGITLRCARCHSHKFDPIPQRDYYRLVAVFKGAMDEFDWLRPLESPVGAARYLPYVTTQERQRWQRNEDRITAGIEQLEAEKKSLQDAAPADNQDHDDRLREIDKRIEQLQAQRAPQPMIRALWDRGEPSPTYLLRRGDYRQPTRLVGPGVPSVLTDGHTPFTVQPPWPGATQTGNRLALARWLTQPNHPLTARVLVNRIWKHHFGRGMVEPLDDFGKAGGQPTHPELLDWLAVRFVEQGWSIKWLQRLMVTSATYRQSAQVTQPRAERDPENRWLSRMPLRRMDAELLFDTLVAVSGRLDRKQFGPPAPLAAQPDGLVTPQPQQGAWRRSIYLQQRRTQPVTILDSFDRPSMSPNCIDRSTSNVAPQALYLTNSRLIRDLSVFLAQRIQTEGGCTPAEQVDYLFLTTLGRSPSAVEAELVSDALERLQQTWSRDKATEQATEAERSRAARQAALASVCHALLNSADFLYID